jgi:hypothetical protein
MDVTFVNTRIEPFLLYLPSALLTYWTITIICGKRKRISPSRAAFLHASLALPPLPSLPVGPGVLWPHQPGTVVSVRAHLSRFSSPKALSPAPCALELTDKSVTATFCPTTAVPAAALNARATAPTSPLLNFECHLAPLCQLPAAMAIVPPRCPEPRARRQATQRCNHACAV